MYNKKYIIKKKWNEHNKKLIYWFGKLIKFIKYTPIFIVGIICLIITTLLSIEKNISLKQDLENLQKDYLEKNREIIKNEVQKVFDYIEHKKLNSEEDLRKNLKARVEEASSLANYI